MTQILGNLFIDGEGAIEDRTGNHSITVVGDTIISSDKYSEFNNSTSSIYFAGTGDYLKIPASNDFVFGSSDFTVDFWVWQNTLQPGTTDRGIITFGAWGTSGSLLIFDTDDPSWNIIMNGSQNHISTPMKEVWLHAAFVRTDNTLSVYYNGVLEASLDCTGQNFTANTDIYVAARPYSLTGRNFAGYIDNIRVVKGQALWTENFDLTEEALFYKSASNYVRPGTVRGMYNLSSKKGNLRGKAKSGFVRPTISQFFTSKNFEEVESFSGYKSVIFDIANNWGHTGSLGIRSIDFWYNGSKISLLPTDFTSYATNEHSVEYNSEKAFDTSLSKTGTGGGTSWLATDGNVTNQRLIVVFDSSQTFDGIRVNNGHGNGNVTEIGAKNVKITVSTDSITDITYNTDITNSTVIFDGQFDEHTGGDVEDEQILTLL